MKNKAVLFFLAMFFFSGWSELKAKSLLDEVNVFIGTGGFGFGVGSTYPGAKVPFGMVSLSPDTSWNGSNISFMHCAGYYYPDNEIRGFSHYHLSGIGIADYGTIRFMPTLGRVPSRITESWYRTKFSHDKESAHPGYYSVILNNGIKAELTATRNSGFHRYIYPQNKNALLVVDLGRGSVDRNSCGGKITVDEKTSTVYGWQINCRGIAGLTVGDYLKGEFDKQGTKIYFYARFNQPVKGFGIFQKGTPQKDATQIQGEKVGAWLDFGRLSSPLLAKVGISLISEEQARINLERQIPGWGFDGVKSQAEKLWEKELSRIEIKGGSHNQRTIFYTAFYHSLLMPTDLTEEGGYYWGFDHKVHRAEGFRYYSDFSLWDTYRTFHPLWILLDPERAKDFAQSLVMMGKQGGYIPKWPTADRYTNCMTSTFADCVLAETYIKGIRGWDYLSGYELIKKVATQPMPKSSVYEGREGLKEYMELGYLPSDKYWESASLTIEHSYNDFCIANFARTLGKEKDAEYFYQRSKNYQNLWDPKDQFLRPKKSNGRFKTFYHPSIWLILWKTDYTEGDAWQWLFAPWHDLEGLAELFGGNNQLISKLEEFLKKGAKEKYNYLPKRYYWHGNEPDIHSAYIFTLVGKPELTQKWVRWILENKYQNAPNGLAGNDDCGTMSAWYIFSSLGFYPISGTDRYILTSPLFKQAVLHLPEGDLIIQAEGAPEKIYIKSVEVDGKELSQLWLNHQQISKGARIKFYLK